jgi:hypothetical protein
VLLGHPSEAQAGSAVADDGDTVDIEWGSPDPSSIKLGSAHTRANAFHYEGTLQLRYRRHDHNDRPTQRAIRVYRLSLGQELNAEVVQLIEHLKEVLRGPCQTVARPDEDDMEPVPVRIIQELVQARASGFGARDPMVGILFDDLKSTLVSKSAEFVQLCVRILVER